MENGSKSGPTQSPEQPFSFSFLSFHWPLSQLPMSRWGLLGAGTCGQPTALCSARGENPDSRNSGMDTSCSVIYWTRRALVDRASVTTVSFTEQYRSRVKGLTDKKDKSFPGAKGERKEEGGFVLPPSLVLWASVHPMPGGALAKRSWAVCAAARRELGLSTQGQKAHWAIHPLPTQSPCGDG